MIPDPKTTAVRPSPPSPVAASDTPIVGWLDGPSRDRLHGWVLDKTSLSRRLTVEVVSGSSRFLVLADRYRADLHQSGLGDGYYGFSVPLRRLDGARTARVACIAPHVELGIANLAIDRRPTSGKSYSFQRGTYTLSVDSIEGGRLSGWAVDTSRPALRRVLQLRWSSRIVARQRATLFRADSVDSERDGLHGFSFAWPLEPAKGRSLLRLLHLGRGHGQIVLEDVDSSLTFPIRP